MAVRDRMRAAGIDALGGDVRVLQLPRRAIAGRSRGATVLTLEANPTEAASAS